MTPTYPTARLLLAIGIAAAALLIVLTLIKLGAEWTPEAYQAAVLGLLVATVAHVGGTFAGAFFASGRRSGPSAGGAVMTAYLASTVVRFIGTPVLAVSLYFALPVQPKPLLIGAAASYLLILVVDIATMLKVMQGGASSVSK
jgi:hypothetical protein